MKKILLLISFLFLSIILSACKSEDDYFSYSIFGNIIGYYGKSDEIIIPEENNGTIINSVYLPSCIHAKKLYIPKTVSSISIDYKNIDIDEIYYDGSINYWVNNVYGGYSSDFIPAEKMFFKDDDGSYYCLADKPLVLSYVEKIEANKLNFSVDKIYIKSDLKYVESAAFGIRRFDHPFEQMYYFKGLRDWCNNVNLSNSLGNFATKEFYVFEDGEYKLVDKLVIPSGVETIEKYQFSHLQYIEEIEINEGVKFVHPYAFENCYNVKKVTLPYSLKGIEEYFNSVFDIEFIYI